MADCAAGGELPLGRHPTAACDGERRAAGVSAAWRAAGDRRGGAPSARALGGAAHPGAAAAGTLVVPELLLGYRCSPQLSARYSPYQLLYGGVAPVIPWAVRKRLSPPVDFDDAALAAQSLFHRAAWVRQACPAAASNLLISQHRDTLRYAAIRTGRYLAKPIQIAPGDYV